jgi:hypothetical protein
MRVTLIEIVNAGRAFTCPDRVEEKWFEKVNAKFILSSRSDGKKLRKSATLIYQGEKVTENGWEACNSPKRVGWNFSESHLVDDEPNFLVFGHLVKRDPVTFLLRITHLCGQYTMLTFAKEIVRQLDLLI